MCVCVYCICLQKTKPRKRFKPFTVVIKCVKVWRKQIHHRHHQRDLHQHQLRPTVPFRNKPERNWRPNSEKMIKVNFQITNACVAFCFWILLQSQQICFCYRNINFIQDTCYLNMCVGNSCIIWIYYVRVCMRVYVLTLEWKFKSDKCQARDDKRRDYWPYHTASNEINHFVNWLL